MDASLVAAMFKINVAIVNFRPAIHGFYSNAYLEPNLGLKDIRTAIQWLHQQNLKNIDYDQVTIGGVGSGASLAAMQVFHDSVENHKLVRPGTEPPKNLLHRGIFLGGTFNSRFALSPSYQKIKLNLILHKFFKQHNLYEYAENEYLNETALTEIFQKQIKNYELTNLQDRISQDELDIFHNLAEIDDKFLKNSRTICLLNSDLTSSISNIIYETVLL